MIVRLALAVLILAVSSVNVLAQRCDSIAASGYGGWKPVTSAPRNGTKVEMLETYGVAPWYGLFYWRAKGTKYKTTAQMFDGKTSKTEIIETVESVGRWVDASDEHRGVSEDSCLFWRPYKGNVQTYVDLTGGAQNSIAYLCAYMHMRYNKKKDACE